MKAKILDANVEDSRREHGSDGDLSTSGGEEHRDSARAGFTLTDARSEAGIGREHPVAPPP